ncbi:MAG: hypothetical protein ACRD18_10245 [Terriglobia bacterium]
MSTRPLQNDELFAQLAREPTQAPAHAPSRLKAKLYSAFIRRQEDSGPLLSLAATRQLGHKLCVFEELWEKLPVGDAAKRFNCCSVCHARVLGERMERPPIYWGHCPYVALAKK